MWKTSIKINYDLLIKNLFSLSQIWQHSLSRRNSKVVVRSWSSFELTNPWSLFSCGALTTPLLLFNTWNHVQFSSRMISRPTWKSRWRVIYLTSKIGVRSFLILYFLGRICQVDSNSRNTAHWPSRTCVKGSVLIRMTIGNPLRDINPSGIQWVGNRGQSCLLPITDIMSSKRSVQRKWSRCITSLRITMKWVDLLSSW